MLQSVCKKCGRPLLAQYDLESVSKCVSKPELMQQMGWINSKRPRMVCVQASGSRPLVSAFESGALFAAEQEHASTRAFGLRVPKALGDFLILDAIRRSHGTAIAVPDEGMIQSVTEICAAEGVFSCPEGAACHAALKNLLKSGWIKTEETIVLFNTGSGLKYFDSP